MKCPVCGTAELVRDTSDLPCIHKGETTLIPAVSGDFRSACTEVVLDMHEAERYGAMVSSFHKQVNAAFAQPDFIINVRKKIKLDQREAGKILGGGGYVGHEFYYIPDSGYT